MPLIFETLQPRVSEGMSFYLRQIGGDWYFRVIPIRAPEQPRHWRLLVDACDSPTVMQSPSRYAPFLTSEVIERSNLAGRLSAIKAKPMSWVHLQENRNLVAWLEAVVATQISATPASPHARVPKSHAPD